MTWQRAILRPGSLPWGPLPWGRCTAGGGKLYLHVFDWPAGPLSVPPVKSDIARAYLLADRDAAPLKISLAADGSITIDLPAAAPDPLISVIVLELK